jgi:hypothetical protein
MAAAGLLIDYVMTVAVSIASGVAAITSAYPSMQLATVWIGVGVIVILLTGNLRGVRQAGAVFGVPTYAFADPGRAFEVNRQAETGVGGLGGAGALRARRPGGARRSGPAAPPAGWRTAAAD